MNKYITTVKPSIGTSIDGNTAYSVGTSFSSPFVFLNEWRKTGRCLLHGRVGGNMANEGYEGGKQK
jgi:hypothetical protein